MTLRLYVVILDSNILSIYTKRSIMNNLFFKYLDSRFHKHYEAHTKQNIDIHHYGPIITISREAGCSAREIAQLFYRSINQGISDNDKKWKCIDKNIILDSAKKLDLPARKIKYVFNSQKKSSMDEIVESLSSRYYKSDKIIRKTIAEVMRGFAEKGNTIIVGRAGVALSQHVNRSLNIRLIAPLQWRIEQISQKHNISEEIAEQYIIEIDAKRTALIEEFYGKKLDNSMFDILFNCKNIPKDEIVQIGMKLLKDRHLI